MGEPTEKSREPNRLDRYIKTRQALDEQVSGIIRREGTPKEKSEMLDMIDEELQRLLNKIEKLQRMDPLKPGKDFFKEVEDNQSIMAEIGKKTPTPIEREVWVNAVAGHYYKFKYELSDRYARAEHRAFKFALPGLIEKANTPEELDNLVRDWIEEIQK